MFAPAPPLEWVEECRRAWLTKREHESVASSREDALSAEAVSRPQLCLFTEEELNEPAPAQKKKTAPGVSFF